VNPLVTLPADYKPPRPYALPPSVSDDQFVEAVGAWLFGDKPEDVAALLKMPLPSLQLMTNTAPWNAVVMRWREEVRKVEAGVLTRLIGKSLTAVATRLVDGDVVVGKTGQQYMKPVSAKDAAQIAALFMDRRRDVYRDIDGTSEKTDPDAIEDIIRIAAKMNRDYDITAKREPLTGVSRVVDTEKDA
jgi:hypothetical protein